MMTSWMTCNTCKTVAINNNTGICLACQGGFTKVIQKDNYLFTEHNDYYPPEEVELWEKISAAEERIKQIDDNQKQGKAEEGHISRCPPNCS